MRSGLKPTMTTYSIRKIAQIVQSAVCTHGATEFSSPSTVSGIVASAPISTAASSARASLLDKAILSRRTQQNRATALRAQWIAASAVDVYQLRIRRNVFARTAPLDLLVPSPFDVSSRDSQTSPLNTDRK